MSFDSAIPVNRIAYGADEGPSRGSRGSTHGSGEKGSGSRQSVNISPETVMKIARAKLHRMVDQKRGYGPRGAIASAPAVGSLLSAKA